MCGHDMGLVAIMSQSAKRLKTVKQRLAVASTPGLSALLSGPRPSGHQRQTTWRQL